MKYKIPRSKWQWKQGNWKPIGCSKSSSKKEVYSHTNLPKEARETSNKQLNYTPKATRKRKKKPKDNRMKKYIKIKAEINEKEMETIAKMN